MNYECGCVEDEHGLKPCPEHVRNQDTDEGEDRKFRKESPLICGCGKCFHSRYGLDAHRRTHHGYYLKS